MENEEITKLNNRLEQLVLNTKQEFGEKRTKTIKEAIGIAQNILKLNPYSVSVCSLLGFLYYSNENYNQALMLFAKAIGIDPKDALSLNRMALLKNNLGDFEQSLVLSEKVLAENEKDNMAKCNKAVSLRYLNQEDKALEIVKDVLNNDKDNTVAHHTYARILLGKKDFITGFKEFEWRKREFSSILENILDDIPFWQGEDLKDKTIIVNPERERDTIMFSRYVFELAKIAHKVIFRCNTYLK